MVFGRAINPAGSRAGRRAQIAEAGTLDDPAGDDHSTSPSNRHSITVPVPT